MHISFATERKAIAGMVPLVDLFWFTLRMALYVSHGKTWRRLKTSLFAFSFIWIKLGWLENESKIISRFWKVNPFFGFHSGMFSAFVILKKYLLKIFATSCFSNVERFFFFFSTYVTVWFHCEPFFFKKGLKSFQKFFFFFFN